MSRTSGSRRTRNRLQLDATYRVDHGRGGVDLPAGATIACTFGIVLILMAVVRVLVRTPANHLAEGR